MFSDVTDLFDELGRSMHSLSDVYNRGRAQLDGAVELDLASASATVDRGALSNALAEIAPPIGKRQLEDLAATLEQGLLVHDDTLVAPAAVLLDPRLSPQLDSTAWRTLGIQPGGSPARAAKQLRALFPNLPAAVLAPENLARLQDAADREQKRVSGFERFSGLATGALQHPNGGPADPPVKGGAGPPYKTPGYPYPGNASSDFPIDGYLQAAACIANANWTIHGFGIEVCMDLACADKVQAALYGPDPTSFWTLLAQLLLKVVILAVTASGYVSTAITTGETYWGLMISGNKTARGVCLFIPGPWTFGLIGPGWATGR
jgi:hypothetical protein